MTVNKMINNIEVQGECHYCYYDYNKECRVEITRKKALKYEIKYLYCEDGELYIEVDKEQ